MTNFDRQRADITRLVDAAADPVEIWITEHSSDLSGCTLADCATRLTLPAVARLVTQAAIAYLIAEHLIEPAREDALFEEAAEELDRVHQMDLEAALTRHLEHQARLGRVLKEGDNQLAQELRRGFVGGPGY